MMPGHAFVIAQGRQRVFGPVAEVLEVDEVDGRARTIERRAAVVAVGRAVLNLRGNTPDLERGSGQRRKIGRQARGHVLDAGVEAGEQLGAPAVGLRIKLPRILVEREKALPDGPLRIALSLEDAVNLSG